MEFAPGQYPTERSYPSSGRERARLERPAQLRLHLQRRAPANLRHHFRRGLARLVGLIIADLVAFGVMRALLRAVRDYDVLGVTLASRLQAALPAGSLNALGGSLNGWQFAAALLLGLLLLGNYGPGDLRRNPRRLFAACALATALPLWATAWTRGLQPVLLQYSATVVLVWLGLLAERLTIDRIAAWIRPPERDRLDTLFVGTAAESQHATASPAFAGGTDYRPIGFVDVQSPPAPGALGHVAELPALLAASAARVVAVCGYLTDKQFQNVVDVALAGGCQVLSVPRAIEIAGVNPTTVWRRGQPLVELNRPAVKASALFLKRVADLSAASVGLLLLGPLLAAMVALIRIESPGPAFFASERWGQGGKRIRVWKFRTMVDGATQMLERDPALKAAYERDVKLRSDPRVTRVGRFLRRWSIDELPQLFNVLLGDMSLVGPRPKLFGEEVRYGPMFGVVLGVPPGMTGLWQVSGRNNLSYEQRIALDVDYVRRCSLALDLKILLRTIPAVLRRHGAA